MIGIKKPQADEIVKFIIETVTAEIKIVSNDIITAFWQACAYKLFSHKVYVVIPEKYSEDDILSLDSLCQLFGLGLVLFNSQKEDDFNFSLRVRPVKHEPDWYYANNNLKLVKKELFDWTNFKNKQRGKKEGRNMGETKMI